LRIQDFDFAQN